ncbi:GIY-YIG nuclease family protein (plasmid) [Chromobacterium amazonense]|uniref:GIY-YIG nuclease family protein n=1 Tax=Chromobacterium amazonense TaxID=1382803 RepID=UPI00237E0DEB|nr:GIY-YIG nuclease family protein [Chromobacterium amazonense]MDE1712700.1 GIY-YIG nuclease family protein [Chromobacterium amazonense]
MPYGKSVRIFLPDATVTGIRHAEIVNRTGQTVACPRTRLDELKQWPETAKPGIYFLFEARLGDSKPLAYIGESENVADRLLTHDRKKEFWNDVVVFTSKDENLTKSHIKYLESRLEASAKTADRYELENGNTPTLSSLPRAERDAMDELLEDIRLVLGTLGYPILEPLVQPKAVPSSSNSPPLLDDSPDDELTFRVHNLVARGIRTNEGFVLKKGSTASKTNSDSISGKIVKMKEQLLADGRLIDQEGHLLLAEDILMSSSSYAAALIAGTARSGPQSWFTSNGKSLKELEDAALALSAAATATDGA